MSFQSRVTPHADGLWRFARRLARSDADADDLLQDALLHALGRWEDLRDPGATRSWLARIVLRTWQSATRRVTRDHRPDEVAVSGFGPEDAVRNRQIGGRLLAAFDQLPIEQSAAVWLVDAEGYTFEETAASLGIAVGTVCSRVARGRAALRLALADLAPEPP